MFKILKAKKEEKIEAKKFNSKIDLRQILVPIILLFLIWFIFFRTKELTITYYGVENNGATYKASTFAAKPAFRTANDGMAELAMANAVSKDALYEESETDESTTSPERYRENKYYRVDTDSFEKIVDDISKVVKDLNGTIKVNNQNSNRKTVYDKEFYPRYQALEFTIDNSVSDLSSIEACLKKWGNIRISNSNITSIEQELTNYEQQLKEMEEARKALQESKDKDWIARQDADLAKKSERIRNQIENAKKQSTYKTYTIDIYEVIKFNVNALSYWYDNNYSLKSAVENMLPEMLKFFAVLIPLTLMGIVLLVTFFTLYRKNKKKVFDEKIEAIKENFNQNNVHFDVKM